MNSPASICWNRENLRVIIITEFRPLWFDYARCWLRVVPLWSLPERAVWVFSPFLVMTAINCANWPKAWNWRLIVPSMSYWSCLLRYEEGAEFARRITSIEQGWLEVILELFLRGLLGYQHIRWRTFQSALDRPSVLVAVEGIKRRVRVALCAHPGQSISVLFGWLVRWRRVFCTRIVVSPPLQSHIFPFAQNAI